MLIQEQRRAYYDQDLQIEAYNLSGIVQKFPNHFHEYYVIGFVEGGKRNLCCKGQHYQVVAGDMLLFNPHDNHYCAPVNGEILDYRALNINLDIMQKAVKEITGQDFIPHFTQNVIYQSEMTQSISDLYDAIINQAPKLEKDEAFFFLLEQIIQDYVKPFNVNQAMKPHQQITKLCQYIQEHYSENITLDDLVEMTQFSKSYLLRSFTKQIGISPYRYLQTIRLDKAKKYLEEGILPIDVAYMTGFTDQSHFTHFFKEFIGLTPKQYQKIFMTPSLETEVTK